MIDLLECLFCDRRSPSRFLNKSEHSRWLISTRFSLPETLRAACSAIAGHLTAIDISVTFDVPVGPAIVVMTLGIALLWYSVLWGFRVRPSGSSLAD